MKLKTGVLVIFLVFGLLGVPNCIFAQDYDDSSNAVLESSIPAMTQTSGLNVQVKGGKGGFSSSKSASKTVKKLSDGDDDGDVSDDDGGSWWIAIIIIIIILVIIAAWYLFLRK